ncbi:hypothetical protein DYB25_002254 [Aphanomyces astaci]|uniref:Uncharacterized protein n=1 Tax=Aphanomyces astaci TaxID=112090 RepID=A0A397DII6_APHAT|nr:hypothetical protein DYB25_002254 [Aphanomyces astaci]RHY65942.1 hypothetical protein DYB30_006233 [Aphanomyces astaci]
MSVGSSVAEELTFPEFIECLFRCSGRFFSLRRHHDGGEAEDVADKFEALVMAMDGHGSVLQVTPLDAVYRPPPRVEVPIMEKALRNAQLKFLRGKYPAI